MADEEETPVVPEPPAPPNYNSILISVKKALNLAADYDPFDPELIMLINSEFAVLYQVKVGPSEPYEIVDATNEWSEFIQDRKSINMVKTYIFARVKQLFDPEVNSFTQEARRKIADEMLFRLNVISDPREW